MAVLQLTGLYICVHYVICWQMFSLLVKVAQGEAKLQSCKEEAACSLQSQGRSHHPARRTKPEENLHASTAGLGQ
jgi:hypothetical protein